MKMSKWNVIGGIMFIVSLSILIITNYEDVIRFIEWIPSVYPILELIILISICITGFILLIEGT